MSGLTDQANMFKSNVKDIKNLKIKKNNLPTLLTTC